MQSNITRNEIERFSIARGAFPIFFSSGIAKGWKNYPCLLAATIFNSRVSLLALTEYKIIEVQSSPSFMEGTFSTRAILVLRGRKFLAASIRTTSPASVRDSTYIAFVVRSGWWTRSITYERTITALQLIHLHLSFAGRIKMGINQTQKM